MGRRKKSVDEIPESSVEVVPSPPAWIDNGYKPIDPLAREQQMIGLAVDLAEQKLRDGTATSQIIEHYLKLAATKTTLDIELAKQQLMLMQAKTEAINADNSAKRDYEEVLRAFRSYGGDEEYDIPWS